MLKLHAPKLIILLIFLCRFSLNGQYFVSPAGSNENDGLSETSPWKTIDFALSAIMPDANDTLFIFPGNYEINHSLYVFPGISLIGRGEDPSETTILCNGENIGIAFDLQNDNYGKGLKNDHFIFGNQVLKNFTILGNKTAGIGIVAIGRNNVTFSNLIIKDFTQGGIQLSAFKEYFVNNYEGRKISGCEIAHCILEENGSLEPTGNYSYFSNISIGGWKGGSVHHCTIIDTIADMDGSGMGIMGAERTKIHDNKIMINVFEQNHWGGIFSVVTGYSAGLEFFNNEVNSGISCENRVAFENMVIPGVPDIMIFNNRFVGTHPNSVGIQAIELYNDNAEIYNNYFENFFHCITSWHGNDTVTNIEIHHNIFRGAEKGYAIHLTMGGSSYDDPSNHSVYRNFNIYNNVFDSYKYGIYNPHGKTDNFNITNNVFFNLSGGVWQHTSEEDCNNIHFETNLVYNYTQLQNDNSATFNNTFTDVDPGFKLQGERPAVWYQASSNASGIIDKGQELGEYTIGFAGSAPDLGAYEYNGTTPARLIAPQFDLPQGKYFGDQKIAITNLNADALVYYTTDGTAPSAATGLLYDKPFTLTQPLTVKAIAIQENQINSVINERYYDVVHEVTETVTIQPGGTQFSTPQIIRLESLTPGATIYYSVNGRSPNSATGYLYEGPLYVDSSVTISAIAYAEGFYQSDISEKKFQIQFDDPGTGIVYNDTSSKFTWSDHYWAHKTNRGLGDYNDDIHIGYNEGAYFEFEFNGRAIAVLMERNTDKTKSADVFIDNIPLTTINLYNNKQVTSDTVFIHGGLSAGNHVLKVIKSGTSGNMAIDAIIVYADPLSVSNTRNHALKIYPQPASDYILVEGLPTETCQDVKIFDLSGKIKLSVPVYPGNTALRLNTGKLDPGIYFLHVKTSKNTVWQKLIIE